jgi:hypothetical protein
MSPAERLSDVRTLAVAVILLTACSTTDPTPSGDAAGVPVPGRVSCGPVAPSFPLAVLEQVGEVDPGFDEPGAILLATLRETEGLPEGERLPARGWIRAVQTEDVVLFVARGEHAQWSMVKVQLRDGVWGFDASGQCRLQPELPVGVGLAVFRLAAPGEVEPGATTVDLLVTETVCNSGEDARGRVRVLDIAPADETVTVVLGVVPRPGGHECPSNPETPFTLQLPEPLGDRVLLDGSSVPARDATSCPDLAVCP